MQNVDHLETCRPGVNLYILWMGKAFGSFGCFGWTQGQCCHVCQRFPHDFKSWRVKYTLEQDIWFSHWDLDQSLILFHHAMTWNAGRITVHYCMSMYVVWWSLLLTIGDFEWFWILRYHAQFFPRSAKKCQLYSPNLVSWVRTLQHMSCFTFFEHVYRCRRFCRRCHNCYACCHCHFDYNVQFVLLCTSLCTSYCRFGPCSYHFYLFFIPSHP